MVRRKIIEIDRERCNGCGLCAQACHEGAIRMVEGKARLVRDIYCDGLGDCLGECPVGAIRIIEREAEDFDPAAVALRQELAAAQAAAGPCTGGGCPGSAARALAPSPVDPGNRGQGASALSHWPVQLHLVPVQAPFFAGATLLVAADCVPFAYAEFHRDILRDRVVVVGCPKLDDGRAYLEKLTRIIAGNSIAAIEVAYMEVPCCGALVRIVAQALAAAGKDLPLRRRLVTIQGRLQDQP